MSEQTPKEKADPTLGCIIVVIALVALGVVMAVLNTSDDKPSSDVTSTPPPAVVPVSAAVLYRAYTGNEIAADGEYRGKVLAVSGIVESVGKDITGTPYVALGGPLRVQCMFPHGMENELVGLRPGQSVVIEGKCNGFLIEVLLTNCRLAAAQ